MGGGGGGPSGSGPRQYASRPNARVAMTEPLRQYEMRGMASPPNGYGPAYNMPPLTGYYGAPPGTGGGPSTTGSAPASCASGSGGGGGGTGATPPTTLFGGYIPPPPPQGGAAFSHSGSGGPGVEHRNTQAAGLKPNGGNAVVAPGGPTYNSGPGGNPSPQPGIARQPPPPPPRQASPGSGAEGDYSGIPCYNPGGNIDNGYSQQRQSPGGHAGYYKPAYDMVAATGGAVGISPGPSQANFHPLSLYGAPHGSTVPHPTMAMPQPYGGMSLPCSPDSGRSSMRMVMMGSVDDIASTTGLDCGQADMGHYPSHLPSGPMSQPTGGRATAMQMSLGGNPWDDVAGSNRRRVETSGMSMEAPLMMPMMMSYGYHRHLHPNVDIPPPTGGGASPLDNPRQSGGHPVRGSIYDGHGGGGGRPVRLPGMDTSGGSGSGSYCRTVEAGGIVATISMGETNGPPTAARRSPNWRLPPSALAAAEPPVLSYEGLPPPVTASKHHPPCSAGAAPHLEIPPPKITGMQTSSSTCSLGSLHLNRGSATGPSQTVRHASGSVLPSLPASVGGSRGSPTSSRPPPPPGKPGPQDGADGCAESQPLAVAGADSGMSRTEAASTCIGALQYSSLRPPTPAGVPIPPQPTSRTGRPTLALGTVSLPTAVPVSEASTGSQLLRSDSASSIPATPNPTQSRPPSCRLQSTEPHAASSPTSTTAPPHPSAGDAGIASSLQTAAPPSSADSVSIRTPVIPRLKRPHSATITSTVAATTTSRSSTAGGGVASSVEAVSLTPTPKRPRNTNVKKVAAAPATVATVIATGDGSAAQASTTNVTWRPSNPTPPEASPRSVKVVSAATGIPPPPPVNRSVVSPPPPPPPEEIPRGPVCSADTVPASPSVQSAPSSPPPPPAAAIPRAEDRAPPLPPLESSSPALESEPASYCSAQRMPAARRSQPVATSGRSATATSAGGRASGGTGSVTPPSTPVTRCRGGRGRGTAVVGAAAAVTNSRGSRVKRGGGATAQPVVSEPTATEDASPGPAGQEAGPAAVADKSASTPRRLTIAPGFPPLDGSSSVSPIAHAASPPGGGPLPQPAPGETSAIQKGSFVIALTADAQGHPCELAISTFKSEAAARAAFEQSASEPAQAASGSEREGEGKAEAGAALNEETAEAATDTPSISERAASPGSPPVEPATFTSAKIVNARGAESGTSPQGKRGGTAAARATPTNRRRRGTLAATVETEDDAPPRAKAAAEEEKEARPSRNERKHRETPAAAAVGTISPDGLLTAADSAVASPLPLPPQRRTRQAPTRVVGATTSTAAPRRQLRTRAAKPAVAAAEKEEPREPAAIDDTAVAPTTTLRRSPRFAARERPPIKPDQVKGAAVKGEKTPLRTPSRYHSITTRSSTRRATKLKEAEAEAEAEAAAAADEVRLAGKLGVTTPMQAEEEEEELAEHPADEPKSTAVGEPEISQPSPQLAAAMEPPAVPAGSVVATPEEVHGEKTTEAEPVIEEQGLRSPSLPGFAPPVIARSTTAASSPRAEAAAPNIAEVVEPVPETGEVTSDQEVVAELRPHRRQPPSPEAAETPTKGFPPSAPMVPPKAQKGRSQSLVMEAVGPGLESVFPPESEKKKEPSLPVLTPPSTSTGRGLKRRLPSSTEETSPVAIGGEESLQPMSEEEEVLSEPEIIFGFEPPPNRPPPAVEMAETYADAAHLDTHNQQLMKLMVTSPTYRELVFCTSNFVIAVGMTCNVTMNTIALALSILHRAMMVFDITEGTDRKALAAACLCLSWKYWDDNEGGMRRSAKVRELAKAVFLVSVKESAWLSLPLRLNVGNEKDGDGGFRMPVEREFVEAAHLELKWIHRDGGAELSQLRERIKLYEMLLLRILGFKVVNDPDIRVFPGLLGFHIHRCFPHIGNDMLATGEGSPKDFDDLHDVALGIVLDFLRWPLACRYPLKSICGAAILKAAVALRLPILYPEPSAPQPPTKAARQSRRGTARKVVEDSTGGTQEEVGPPSLDDSIAKLTASSNFLEWAADQEEMDRLSCIMRDMRQIYDWTEEVSQRLS